MADTSTDNITVEKLKSNSSTGWVVKQGGRIRQIEKKEKSEKNPNPSWTDTYVNEEGKQKCIAVYSGTLAISEKNLPPEIHSLDDFYKASQSGTYRPTHFIEFKNDNGQEMMVSYDASGEKSTYMKDENDRWVKQQSTASVQTQSVEQTEQPTASAESTPQPVQTEQPTASAESALPPVQTEQPTASAESTPQPVQTEQPTASAESALPPVQTEQPTASAKDIPQPEQTPSAQTQPTKQTPPSVQTPTPEQSGQPQASAKDIPQPEQTQSVDQTPSAQTPAPVQTPPSAQTPTPEQSGQPQASAKDIPQPEQTQSVDQTPSAQTQTAKQEAARQVSIQPRIVHKYEEADYKHATARLKRMEKIYGKDAIERALTRLQEMERNGEIPTGLSADGKSLRSNAEIYLYKALQSKELYHPDEPVYQVKGNKITRKKECSLSEKLGGSNRELVETLLGSKQPETTTQLADQVMKTEDAISERGHAVLGVKVKQPKMSFKPGRKPGYEAAEVYIDGTGQIVPKPEQKRANSGRDTSGITQTGNDQSRLASILSQSGKEVFDVTFPPEHPMPRPVSRDS